MTRVENENHGFFQWEICKFCHKSLDSLGLIQQIQAESRQRLANNNNILIHATNLNKATMLKVNHQIC